MQETLALDDFDHRLLDLVRQNNLTPARELAEKVGLSESAVSRRLRRLRAEKVIVADVAVVDRGRLEKALTMHVLVEMEREGTAVIDALMRRLKSRPEVHGLWYTTGHVDFILYVVVPDMEAYDTFTREALSDDDRVRNFTTLLTIREVTSFDPSQRVISRTRS